MPEIKNVSKLLFMISPCYNTCSTKTQRMKECVAAIALL